MAKYKEIEDKVIDSLRGMKAHQRYYSRNAMCKKYDISRSTADSVIGHLIERGWMYAVKGSGTFVSPQISEITKITDSESVYTVGIIMPDVRYSVYPEMFNGVIEYLNMKKIGYIICNTDDDSSREYTIIQKLLATNVDGVIIVPSAIPDIRNYEYLQKRNIPFVFWNRSMDALPHVPQVCLNGYHGGQIATSHLIENGYRRIAYLAPKRFRSSMDRFYGYDSALANAGIDTDSSLVHLYLEHDQESGIQEQVRKMLNYRQPPDSFLCFIDTMAVSVYQVLVDEGLKVSDDIGLIGFESSIHWTDAHMEPKLTYVDINSSQSGFMAAQILFNQIRNKDSSIPSSLCVVRPVLVVRDTCKGKRK